MGFPSLAQSLNYKLKKLPDINQEALEVGAARFELTTLALKAPRDKSAKNLLAPRFLMRTSIFIASARVWNSAVQAIFQGIPILIDGVSP